MSWLHATARTLAAAIAIMVAARCGQADAEPRSRFEPQVTPKGIAFHYRDDPSTPFAAISFGLRDIWGLTTTGQAFCSVVSLH